MQAVSQLSSFVQRRLLSLLILAYITGTLAPAFGLWIRESKLGSVSVLGERMDVSLLMILLAVLLFNAGLGMRVEQISRVLRCWTVMAAGLLANVAVPVFYIAAIAAAMRAWHNPDETQSILVGLALVASMPIAGSSTAWAQNANGNLAVSLGLVLFSTILSPLVTPTALDLLGGLTTGQYAEALEGLGAYGTGGFLGLWVVMPSLVGIAMRAWLGEARVAAGKPVIKLAITAGLCLITFAFAYGLGRVLQTDRDVTVSLMFGLGMNNNGTALVLAALALAQFPRVMLPIIFYNVLQHVAAGIVHGWMTTSGSDDPPAVASAPAAVGAAR
jgi:BASS family bile acid:Na+ symporter